MASRNRPDRARTMTAVLAATGLVALAGAMGCSGTSDETASTSQADTAQGQGGGGAVAIPSEAAIGVATRLDGWDGVNNLFNDGPFYFGGQPDEVSLVRLVKDMGVTTIISIRTEREMERLGFDEQAVAQGLGAVYINIPVSSATFSAADVERFAQAVEAADGPMLVHCGSSNRVGGMWAAYLALKRDIDANTAIERGRAAGLRPGGMVEAVGRVLSEGG